MAGRLVPVPSEPEVIGLIELARTMEAEGADRRAVRAAELVLARSAGLTYSEEVVWMDYEELDVGSVGAA